MNLRDWKGKIVRFFCFSDKKDYDYQKEEVVAAYKEELENQILKGHFYVAKKMLRLREEKNINVDIKEICEKVARSALARDYTKKNEKINKKIIDFIRKEKIDIDFNMIGQETLEQILANREVCSISLVKLVKMFVKKNITVNPERACTKILIDHLIVKEWTGGGVMRFASRMNLLEKKDMMKTVVDLYTMALEKNMETEQWYTMKYMIGVIEKYNLNIPNLAKAKEWYIKYQEDWYNWYIKSQEEA